MSRPYLTKICGVTNEEDAFFALEAGANTLGFNFWSQSPRFLERQLALTICQKLPTTALKVGVVVIESEQPQAQIAQFDRQLYFLDVLQLHGLSSAEAIPETRCHLWVATTPGDAQRFRAFDIIIDSSWGQGESADWEEVGRLDRDLILSGGLDATNVGAAIAALRPSGVDVCSGVESEPGVKDRHRMRAFIENASLAFAALES